MVTNTPLAPKLVLSDDQAWHHARRICMAPTGEIVSKIKTQGLDAWLKQQLNPGSIPDSAYASERAVLLPFYGVGFKDFYNTSREMNSNSGLHSVIARTGLIHESWKSERYLQTSMLNLWIDHFSVNGGVYTLGIMDYINDLRAGAMGKFSTLLQSVYAGRSIQEFLDGNTNTKAAPNQNLARELHELHTVGVNGGYTQNDVISVSRLLSGVTFHPTLGNVVYDPSRHDSQPVKSLGWSSPNNASTSDGIAATVNSYLNYLAMRPATAKFISGKLVRWFIGEESYPALISKLSSVYLSSSSNITPVLQVLFASTEFKNSIGMKYRRPQAQAASIMALSGTKGIKAPDYPDVYPFNKLMARLMEAYHYPMSWIFPDGFPQRAGYWTAISAYDGQLLLSSTAYELADGRTFPCLSTPDYMKRFGISPTDTYATAIPKMFSFVTGHTPDSTTLLNVARVWDNSSLVSLSSTVNASRIAYAFQAVVTSPYFQVL